jgi:hypothetical protein
VTCLLQGKPDEQSPDRNQNHRHCLSNVIVQVTLLDLCSTVRVPLEYVPVMGNVVPSPVRASPLKEAPLILPICTVGTLVAQPVSHRA